MENNLLKTLRKDHKSRFFGVPADVTGIVTEMCRTYDIVNTVHFNVEGTDENGVYDPQMCVMRSGELALELNGNILIMSPDTLQIKRTIQINPRILGKKFVTHFCNIVNDDFLLIATDDCIHDTFIRVSASKTKILDDLFGDDELPIYSMTSHKDKIYIARDADDPDFHYADFIYVFDCALRIVDKIYINFRTTTIWVCEQKIAIDGYIFDTQTRESGLRVYSFDQITKTSGRREFSTKQPSPLQYGAVCSFDPKTQLVYSFSGTELSVYDGRNFAVQIPEFEHEHGLIVLPHKTIALVGWIDDDLDRIAVVLCSKHFV